MVQKLMFIAMLSWSGQSLAANSYSISPMDVGNAHFVPERFVENGRVVGSAWVEGGLGSAAIWTSESIEFLGGEQSRAFDANANGIVVGSAREFLTNDQAALWNPNLQHIGNWNMHYETSARGINSSGVIVGYAFDHPGVQPLRWERNGAGWVVTQLGAGGMSGGAFDISDSGIIVGSTSTPNRPHNPMPAQWTESGMKWLDILGGWEGSALRVNAHGDMVGWYQTVTGEQGIHGISWLNGKPIDLGVLDDDLDSWANGLNDRGSIVGWSGFFPNGSVDDDRAVLWENGVVFDLNALLPAASGWHLYNAVDIDNDGRIIGRGQYNNQVRGFIMTPIPEPITAPLLFLSLLGWYSHHRKTSRVRSRRVS